MSWKYQVTANNAWKYIVSAFNAWKYQVAAGSSVILVDVEHSGSTQTDFILPLNIHRGSAEVDETGRDVYLNDNSEADFSDVIFTDEDDNVLESYLHSQGNYEFIQTQYRGGKINLVDADGNLYSSYLDNGDAFSYQKFYKSSDNGVTWDEIHSTTGSIWPLFIDSNGNIYYCNRGTFGLYRSIDGGINFSMVFDFSDVSGYINTFGIDEATDGSLYFGRYQPGLNNARIFKSTDGGVNWVQVWHDNTLQHIHGLRIDQATGYIYAGVDDSTDFTIVRSIDEGANWTKIYVGDGGNSTGIICGDGWRLFGGESSNVVSILRTTDDINFTNVLKTDYTIKSLRYIDGVAYALGQAFFRNYYPAIFRSTDDGLTWETIWMHGFDRSIVGAGYANDFIDFNIPEGDDSLVTISQSLPEDEYPTARLYHGNRHYQALFYVKIPTLPATSVLKIKTEATLVSDKTIFDYLPSTDLLLRYKLNEGEGSDVLDSSGNDKHGTIRPTGIGSWNAFDLKRAGSLYPPVVQIGASYYFNGTVPADASRVEVTDSGTDPDLQMIKNFSVIVWTKIPSAIGATLIGKGKGNDLAWAFTVSGTFGTIGFSMGNGAARSNIYSSNAPFHPNGAANYPWIANDVVHMIGFVIDNEATPNIRFFIDGNLLLAQALPYNIIANVDPITIGMENQDSWTFVVGSLDDILIYDRQLTELELRGIYEGRPLLEDEPTITT